MNLLNKVNSFLNSNFCVSLVRLRPTTPDASAATRDPSLALPHEPVGGEPCAPCAACRKTKYRARERRVFCVACAEWVCAAGECQLEHIRNAHQL